MERAQDRAGVYVYRLRVGSGGGKVCSRYVVYICIFFSLQEGWALERTEAGVE